VRLTPRGGRDSLDGWALDPDGRPYLKARVAAPPVEGEANAALIKLIAKTLDVPKSAVTMVSGETARIKTLQIEGMAQDDVMGKLGPPLPRGERGRGEGAALDIEGLTREAERLMRQP
jgi:uncharacterized protein (TIGR00251 family)